MRQSLLSKFYAFFSRKNIQGEKKQKSNLYQRLHVVIICFTIAFSLVTIKLIKVSTKGKESLVNNERSMYVSRNEIVDRNGSILAVDLGIVSLYAIPKLIFDPNYAAEKLVKIFPDLKKEELKKILSNGKNFAWIKRNITPKQQYEVNNLGIPGLEFEKGSKRIYPQGNLFSHVLGYVDTDGNGLAGIEKQFDSVLKDSKNGKMQLSLDVRVQSIVHDELIKSINEFRAKGGVGVVIDANNGEMLSMVSMPDFDPHYPNRAKPEQMFNQVSLGVYEVGSIMKGITIAMALEDKAVTLRDIYYVKAPIKASRFTINDFRIKFTYMSVPQIFMHSSNIGTAMISLEVGGAKQRKYLKKFGFFDPLKIEIPEKGQPIYPSEKNWSDISTMTISFGHGMAISSLHFIRGAMAMVNGGYVYEPTLFLTRDKEPTPVTRVLSEETSNLMRKLMRMTVVQGSGKKAEAKGYLVGGKTGSAEKAGKGGYSKTEKLSLFFSAFPINDPKYVMLVVLDDPRPNEKTPFTGGGWTAAPLSGRIISRIAPILNVKPIDQDDPKIKEQLWVDYQPETEMADRSF